MAKTTIDQVRNVALVGHGGAGKTMLIESMLFAAGVTKRLGAVDEGTSVSADDPEEKDRQNSINAAVVHLSHKDVAMNLIDAPGYPDYVAEAIESLRAVETAVIVIGAAAGIGVNTRRMWAEAEREGLARFIVVSRMSADNVMFEDLLTQIQEVFGKQCIPMTLPVGQAKQFSGVVSTVKLPDAIPDGVLGDPQSTHDNLHETALEADDTLLERYLEGEELSEAEITGAIAKAVAAGLVVPVFVLDSLKEATPGKPGIGVAELMDAVADFAPSPVTGVHRKLVDGETETEILPTPDGPFIAQVFKILTDPFVGKLSYTRVFSGKLSPENGLNIARTGEHYKINQFLRLQGKDQSPIPQVAAGDILAIPKLEDLRLGDTLTDGKVKGSVASVPFPQPMVSLAVEPKSRGDEGKISGALAKMAEEDPTFKVSRDRQTGETVISGISTLHLEMMLSRMKRRFNVEVSTKQPKIPYLETVISKAEGHYRHKKQTGGRGQFGEVYLRVEPQERGKGFEFVDEIFGGSIPSNFMPAVEKGIREACDKGIIAGFPVIDVKVAVYDGKDHPVDSSEAAFKIAGGRAFADAFEKAQPVLLEPIVIVEVTVPSNFLGDITGDINSRRGRIIGMDSAAGMQIVRTQVPLSEVLRYATELRSMTGGQGSYTLEFSHYDVVPGNIAQGIIAQHKKEKDEDED